MPWRAPLVSAASAVVGLWLAVGGSAGCATTSARAPEGEPPAAGTFHTVRPGETVWDIARRHGLSVEEIVEVNGLPSADEVAAGQVLFLPAGGHTVDDEPPPPPEPDDEPPPPPGDAPLAWPVDGVVLRDFAAPGKSKAAFDGLLVAAPAGTPVRAAADGEVKFVGDQGTDYGVLVVVAHAGDLTTVYGHVEEAAVKPGDRVRAGQRIATVGTSGGAESPRLHFQVRRGRTAVDPLPLLPP